MTRGSLVLVGALMVVALAGGGCTVFLVGGGAAIGAGTVAYVTGEQKATEEAPLDQVYNAAEKAMAELEFKTIDKKKDATAGKIVARTVADKKIEVNLARVTEKLTEVRIRIGTWGDDSLSRLILQKIEGHLKK